MVATIASLQNYSTVGGYGSPPLDPSGPAQVAPGGTQSALNLTAAQVVKATPGRLIKLLVVAPGSAGSLTVNDCATTGAAAATNEILTIAFGSLSIGQVIALDWPCSVGIVVSLVPSAGSPQFSISFN